MSNIHNKPGRPSKLDLLKPELIRHITKVERARAKGLTSGKEADMVDRFCYTHDISRPTYYRWKSKVKPDLYSRGGRSLNQADAFQAKKEEAKQGDWVDMAYANLPNWAFKMLEKVIEQQVEHSKQKGLKAPSVMHRMEMANLLIRGIEEIGAANGTIVKDVFRKNWKKELYLQLNNSQYPGAPTYGTGWIRYNINTAKNMLSPEMVGANYGSDDDIFM